MKRKEKDFIGCFKMCWNFDDFLVDSIHKILDFYEISAVQRRATRDQKQLKFHLFLNVRILFCYISQRFSSRYQKLCINV